jgi:hypothetical protein
MAHRTWVLKARGIASTGIAGRREQGGNLPPLAVQAADGRGADVLGGGLGDRCPDTGSLRGDVRAFLANARAALEHPLAQAIIPDLPAEARRNVELAEALLTSVRDPRRANSGDMVVRAIERGEPPADTDVELCLDFLAGPSTGG